MASKPPLANTTPADAAQRLLDSSAMAMFSVDRKYRYTAFNRAHARFMQTRYQTEIAPGLCVMDVITSAEDRKWVQRDLDRALAGEQFIHTIDSNTGDPVRHYFMLHYDPIVDENGMVMGVTVVAEDVTEIKSTHQELQDSENLFRASFMLATVGVMQVSPAGDFMQVNPAFCEMLGYREEELCGMKFNDVTYEEDRSIGLNMLNEMVSGQSPTVRFEKRYRRKDGSLMWADISSTPFRNAAGETVYFISHVRDISEAKRIQQELVAHQAHLGEVVQERTQQLYTTEALYRSLFENISSIILLFDPVKGTILDANPAACEFFERDYAALIQSSMADLMLICETDLRTHAARIQAGEKIYLEATYRRSDGEIRNLGVYPGMIQHKQAPAILAVLHDVTDRQKAEAEIAFNASILEQVHNGVIAVDMRNTIVYWNQYAEFLYQWTSEEALGRNIVELLATEESKPTVFKSYKTLKREGHWEGELALKRKDGTTVETQITNARLKDAEGKTIGFIGICADITERKQLEEQLRTSEEKWRTIFDILPVGVSIVDVEHNVTDTNPALSQILGISEDGIRNGKYKARKYLNADLSPMQEHQAPSVRAVKEQAVIRDVEIGVVKEDGEMIWTSVSARPLKSGESSATVTVDITQRKQMEMDLMERVKELTYLHEVSRLLEDRTISEADLCQRVVSLLLTSVHHPDQATVTLEVNGKRFQAGVPREDLEACLAATIMIQAAEGGQVSICYPEPALYLLPEEQNMLNNLAGMLGIWFDRKSSEEQVRKLSRAVEQSPVSIVISDTSGRIEYVNPRFESLTGYALDEIRGENPRILQSGYTPPEEYKRLWDTILAGQVWTGEFSNRKKNGEIYWETASISPILSEDGSITHFLAIKEDVTERKQYQQHIVDALAFNQTIFDSSPIGIAIYNAVGNCISANQAAADIKGTTIENLLKQNFHTIPTWKETGLYAAAQLALETDQPVTLQANFTSTFDKQMWLNATFVCFQSGGDTHLLFMFEDDSLRQQAEMELKRSNDKLENLVRNLERSNRNADLLRQMSEMLQVCSGLEEAYAVIEQFAPLIFVDTGGAVFVTAGNPRNLSAVSTWGKNLATDLAFSIDHCWALRRAQAYTVSASNPGLKCRHMSKSYSGCYLDIPLAASGEAIGLLHLERPLAEESDKILQELAHLFADNVSLSLSNIKLRETLRSQSVRDPLTHAYNRRYMEEALDRELARAKRKSETVGLLMLDIDHFKNFNDTFGHAAGDLVLTRLSALLHAHVRGEDIVCRFGGEEFLMILPGTTYDVTVQRAEEIRLAAQTLQIEFNSQYLGTISISIGVAVYPKDGSFVAEILHKADTALYRAKANGRNRVEVA